MGFAATTRGNNKRQLARSYGEALENLACLRDGTRTLIGRALARSLAHNVVRDSANGAEYVDPAVCGNWVTKARVFVARSVKRRCRLTPFMLARSLARTITIGS